MASCLVPVFPAVMMALEHIKELDKQLKEEKVPFNPEASHHLKEIAAAVTELETSRRSVHEQLEVETIENGKVRHKIHKMRDKMSQDIMANVTAARESNAKEMEELHADLNSTSELHKAMLNRQEELNRQNTLLLPERDQVKTQHEGDVSALNHQISLKLSRQCQLQQTLDKVEELKIRISATKGSRSALERDMVRERETSEGTKKCLLDNVEQQAGNALKQKQDNARQTKRLKKSAARLLDLDNRLAELTHRSAWLERAVARQAASRGRCEEQLKKATLTHLDSVRQVETSQRELGELQQRYQTASQRLQEDLILVDRNLEEERAAGSVHRECMALATETLKARQHEAKEARAVHLGLSQRLERTGRHLEERLAFIDKYCVEVRDMEEEMGKLLENTLLNGVLFQEGQEKLRRRLELELRGLREAEEEMGRLGRLLQDVKKEQEAHVAKATTDISGARKRYRELSGEEETLGRSLASSHEVDALTGQMTRAELDFVQTDGGYHAQIERLTCNTQRVQTQVKVKRKELEESEGRLREAEESHGRVESELRGLERLVAGLRTEKSRLERSTQELREETGVLLKPREEMKAALQAEHALHRGLLDSQASELRAAEAGVLRGGRKLEQVSLENSRMQLSIQRMRKDIANAREDTERHRKRIPALREAEEAIFQRVRQAWGDDLLLTREDRHGDRHLLESFGALLCRLENRGVQFESVNARVQQELLHIGTLGY